MGRSLAQLATVITRQTGVWCLTVALASAPPAHAQPSPQDVVSTARLQSLMRMCQQQVRDQMTIASDQESASQDFRDAVLDCLRDNRAGFPVR
jgi:hypothetical protein